MWPLSFPQIKKIPNDRKLTPSKHSFLTPANKQFFNPPKNYFIQFAERCGAFKNDLNSRIFNCECSRNKQV